MYGKQTEEIDRELNRTKDGERVSEIKSFHIYVIAPVPSCFALEINALNWEMANYFSKEN